jgi:hypothetical protein
MIDQPIAPTTPKVWIDFSRVNSPGVKDHHFYLSQVFI